MTDFVDAVEPQGDLPEIDEEAPYGYTVDRKTGVRRPKKLPGRPGSGTSTKIQPDGGTSAFREPPSIEDLKVKAESSKAKPPADRAPGQDKSRGKKGKAEPAEVPPFRAGPIAKGMNSLYRKAAKIISVMDPEIGAAIASCTRKADEDDVTVGEAWEELARVNPRIRAFLLKLITGGAWGQLFWAHAPIFMAVLMKDSIRKKVPMMGLVTAFLSDDGTDTPNFPQQAEDFSGGMFSGLSEADVQQAMNFAQAMMGPMMNRTPDSPRVIEIEQFPETEDE